MIRKVIKKITAVFLAAVMAVGTAACDKEESYRIVKLAEYNGEVTYSRDGETNAVYDNMNFEINDDVETFSSANAEISLDGDKSITMQENTRLKMQGDNNNQTIISLEKGEIVNNITKPLTSGALYEVRTSNATIGVRGTIFWVKSDEDITYVYCEVGVVYISCGNAEEEITAGQSVVVENDEIRIITSNEIIDEVSNEAILLLPSLQEKPDETTEAVSESTVITTEAESANTTASTSAIDISEATETTLAAVETSTTAEAATTTAAATTPDEATTTVGTTTEKITTTTAKATTTTPKATTTTEIVEETVEHTGEKGPTVDDYELVPFSLKVPEKISFSADNSTAYVGDVSLAFLGGDMWWLNNEKWVATDILLKIDARNWLGEEIYNYSHNNDDGSVDCGAIYSSASLQLLQIENYKWKTMSENSYLTIPNGEQVKYNKLLIGTTYFTDKTPYSYSEAYYKEDSGDSSIVCIISVSFNDKGNVESINVQDGNYNFLKKVKYDEDGYLISEENSNGASSQTKEKGPTTNDYDLLPYPTKVAKKITFSSDREYAYVGEQVLEVDSDGDSYSIYDDSSHATLFYEDYSQPYYMYINWRENYSADYSTKGNLIRAINENKEKVPDGSYVTLPNGEKLSYTTLTTQTYYEADGTLIQHIEYYKTNDDITNNTVCNIQTSFYANGNVKSITIRDGDDNTIKETKYDIDGYLISE